MLIVVLGLAPELIVSCYSAAIKTPAQLQHSTVFTPGPKQGACLAQFKGAGAKMGLAIKYVLSPDLHTPPIPVQEEG